MNPAMRRFYKRIRFSSVLGIVVILFWAFISVIPILFMFLTTFKVEAMIWKYPIVWLPNPPTLANFKEAFRYINVGRLFFNSVFVASVTTFIQAIIASLAAFAFARRRFAGREAIFLGFLATMMIPQYVLLIPLYIIIAKFNLMNTYAALILPSLISAFSIFLLRQFFRSIPIDLDESARIDGCNRLQILYKIILPLSQPALVSVSIFVFMGSWNNFLWPLLVTSNPDLRLLPLGLSYFQIANLTRYGPLMAAAAMASTPLIIVFLAAQKRFIEGLALTGIKG
jgi:multiple sugar transport system permease protein